MSIEKLTDDCLELVFIHCGACPLNRCILSQVCRRWHVIARRQSVWRSLMLDKPTLVHAYTRLLQSSEWQQQLEAVRRLGIRKPYETRRHVHLEHLLPVVMPNVLQVDTLHLCLEEIMNVLKQLPRVRTIHCQAIEPWCATRSFDIHALIQGNNSRQVEFHFRDMAGFTTIATTPLQQQQHIHTLRVINLRSEDYNQVDSFLKSLTAEEEEDGDIHNDYLMQWSNMQSQLVQKYRWIANMPNLTHLTFGSCYSWIRDVWLQALLPICPQLQHLELHGWRRLGIPSSSSSSSSSTGLVGSIGNSAQQAICQCFEAAHDLKTLVLVDFLIEPPLSVSARNVCICYTEDWPDPLDGQQLSAFMDDIQGVQDITIKIPPRQIPHIVSYCTHPAMKIEIQRFKLA